VEILISNQARVMLAVPKNQEVGKLEGIEWFEKIRILLSISVLISLSSNIFSLNKIGGKTDCSFKVEVCRKF